MLTKADIKMIKSLRERGERNAHGVFVAEGDKLISELVGSRLRVRRLFATSGSLHSAHERAESVTTAEMERITFLRSAPQSLALIELPRVEVAKREKGLTLVLDGVQDPGNIGTIIRLAHWYGVRQIFCSSESVDCFSPKVVQSTMGAIAAVEVVYCDLVEFLSAQEVPIYGTFLTQSNNMYDCQIPQTQDAIIVMGSEGQGISVAVEKLVSERLYIPPYPADATTVESLNVGVATAIIVSEFRRRGV